MFDKQNATNIPTKIGAPLAKRNKYPKQIGARLAKRNEYPKQIGARLAKRNEYPIFPKTKNNYKY